jgi:hypothetical protein
MHEVEAQARILLDRAGRITRSAVLRVTGVWIPPIREPRSTFETRMNELAGSPDQLRSELTVTQRREMLDTLKSARTRLGLSHEQIAERIDPDLDASYVDAFERGAWSSLGFADGYAKAVGMRLNVSLHEDRLAAPRDAVQKQLARLVPASARAAAQVSPAMPAESSAEGLAL